MSEKHLITKPAMVFSFFTIISRIFGFIRDILAAALFGAGALWDAFVIAFTIPNLLRRILGEGALGSAFVPVFSEYRHNSGEKEGWRIANIVVTLLFVMSVILTITVILTIGVVKGLVPLGERYLLVLTLCQYMFPYMIFVCMVGLFMGILSVFHHLATPAFAPALFNLIMIVVMVFLMRTGGLVGEFKLRMVALSVIAGGFCAWVIHLPILHAKGMRYRFILDLKHPGVKRIFSLMIPMIIGFGVLQINVIIDRFLALWLGPGAASKLYFGNRIMQLPLGIFGAALAVSGLSLMSKQFARNDMNAFRETLSYSFRLAVYIALPACVGLMILSEPIVKILFEHGKFTHDATIGSAQVLWFYSIGLCAYLGLKVVTQGFYAMQDAKTPMKVAVKMVGLNLLLNIILMIPLKEAGLALATAICAVLNVFILSGKLAKSISWDWRKDLKKSMLKNIISATAMAIVCVFVSSSLFHFVDKSIGFQFVYLVVVLFVSVGVYLITSFVLKSREIIEIISVFSKK